MIKSFYYNRIDWLTIKWNYFIYICYLLVIYVDNISVFFFLLFASLSLLTRKHSTSYASYVHTRRISIMPYLHNLCIIRLSTHTLFIMRTILYLVCLHTNDNRETTIVILYTNFGSPYCWFNSCTLTLHVWRSFNKASHVT